MKKQTAVEYYDKMLAQIFNEFLKDEISKIELITKIQNAFYPAKELEREQIINAYDAGTFYLEGGLYYKETFENQTECEFNYYDIRAGKCQHAKVVHGKIICLLKDC
jgi:hypothetical protein